MKREQVTLLGASGTMGWQAFLELWKRRDRYDIVLLLRPSPRNKELFAPYARQAGIPPTQGWGRAQGDGLTIVWGDATCYLDVVQAVCGADWVLDAMAVISPQADYYPHLAWAVNAGAIAHLVRAIEAEPGGAERIKLVYTGTVAETGDRLGCIHWGRVGDPLKPAVYGIYDVTKVTGERAVLESNIRHWASLRLTFIMPTLYRDLLTLQDPIMFHLPIASFMENITDRDAGFGLVNCLDIPGDSDFWRRVYNMGGGPGMRCTAYDFLDQNFRANGLSGIRAVTERRWFALRNFHMQYYEDGSLLDAYLHHWRDSLADYWQLVSESMPAAMKAVVLSCRRIPPFRRLVEKEAYRRLQAMAERHRNGTAHWYRQRNDHRITAFYKDYATYESIPGWGVDMPQLDPEPACYRLNHGYDEAKAQLELADLRGAAAFRGGECLSAAWEGDLYHAVQWRCACGHQFSARPFTVLKAGHWCPECLPPPWDYDAEARRNPFFAQVWYPNHDPQEYNRYPADCIRDIAGADQD